ncbi:MAG TPA: hypothetical protein VM662_00355 [Sphingomonas sp.]|nr:hypothetical protein [Sphingomonas sp.]
MIGAALLLMLAAQSQSQQQPLRQEGPAAWPDTVEEAYDLPDTATLARTYERAACVVNASGEKVDTALAKDYRSPQYKRAFETIFQNNAGCFGKRGGLPRASLVLTGAMAEHLLARDKIALNVRLARAATGPAPKAASESEAAAICTVRSLPDETAAWLATKPASAEAEAAARPVETVFNRCASGAEKANVAGPRLRALVALAALRSVNTSGTAAASN